MGDFAQCLREGDLNGIRSADKAEYHNHIHLGAPAKALLRAGVSLPEIPAQYNGLEDMNVTVKKLLAISATAQGHITFWRAALEYAGQNGVTVLSPSFGGCLRRYFGGAFEAGYRAFRALRDETACGMQLLPELALKRGKSASELERMLEDAIDSGVFHAVDLIGPEEYPVGEYANLFRRAHEAGLVCRAHIGEFSGPETIAEHVELLGLDEIHHGITAVRSRYVMDMLRERQITLHVCPGSNVCTGAAYSLAEHPIGALYRAGISVTLNSDDCLLFGNSLAEEYLAVYRAGLLAPDELEHIRQHALSLYGD